MCLLFRAFRCSSFLILCLVTSTCSKQNKENFVSNVLEENVLSTAIPLEMNDVWYPSDSIYSYRYYVYADSVLIVENRKAAGHFLDFYNIRTQKLVASKLPYGEGPGELLFAQMNYEGNVMRVTDYINRRLYNVEIDKINDPNYIPPYISYSKNLIITSSPVLYGDSVLCANSFHYVNLQYGINQRPSRIIVAATRNTDDYSTSMNFDYLTANVGQGLLGANSKLGKIFFASFDASFIEFYNSNLDLVKKVIGPVSLPESNLSISINKDGMRDVCYKGTNQPEAYTEFTALNDRLYFIYTGKTVSWNKINDYHSYILCFDWDGELVNCYSVPTRISSLSVSSSESNAFFATVKDENGNPKLVKLSAK